MGTEVKIDKEGRDFTSDHRRFTLQCQFPFLDSLKHFQSFAFFSAHD
jgi:hypothetical protein